MAYEISTATDHYNLLAKLRTFVESTLPVAERYTVMRAVTTGDDHEVIWKAPGLSGTEEIYFGIKTYQSVTSDYYNFKISAFTGYVASNSFETQPGVNLKGIPLWNGPTIPYWAQADGQQLTFFAKIENVYIPCTLGKFLPYNTSYQYPYPVMAGGCLPSDSATRYSDETYNAWFIDGTGTTALSLRKIDGSWISPDVYPQAGARTLRNTIDDSNTAAGYYAPHKIIFSDSSPNVYGEHPSVFYISGFNNSVESTFVIDSVTYVVMRNIHRLDFRDYVALRLI